LGNTVFGDNTYYVRRVNVFSLVSHLKHKAIIISAEYTPMQLVVQTGGNNNIVINKRYKAFF